MILTTGVLVSLCLPQSAGPMVGFPHTISVSPGTTGGGSALGHAEVWVKQAGVVSTAPAPLPGGFAGNPDFRIGSIMPGLGTYPDIDATSIGFDWILSDAGGRMVVPPLGWGMLTFSVSRSAVGIAGGAVARESMGDGAWSDLFSYVVPGSAGNPSEVGVTLRAQNANEIAISQTAGNVDAHDVFTAGYALAPVIFASLRPNPNFYFSVTKATLGAVPSSWWSGTAPSGATILVTQWDPSSGSWSVPLPFALYKELGLSVHEDVDALAMDETSDRLLFSTTTASRDQLLVGIPTASGDWDVFDYSQQGGGKVSGSLGLLKGDNVDAICSLDPGSPGGGAFLQQAFGTPLPRALIPGLPHRTTASAYRSYDPVVGQDILHTTLIGWPGPDPNRPMPSVGILAVSVPPFPHLIIAQTFIRDPLGSRFPGGPVEFSIPLPPPFSGSFQQFQLNWITGELLNTRNLDLPMPLVIRL